MMKPMLLLALLAFPGAAIANCSAALGSVETVPIVQYDPFAGGSATADIGFGLILTGDTADCRLGLSIAGLMPGSSRHALLGSVPLLYRLLLNGQELSDNPDAAREVTRSDIDAKRVTVRIEVPAGQIGLAGLYSDPVTLRLVDLNAGGAILGQDRQTSVNIAMQSRAQINLAGSDIANGAFGIARLDFGALAQNARRSARVQVRSTAPVTIRMASENGGSLRRINGHGEALNYRLNFDGAPLSLAVGGYSVSRDASPSAAGSSYALDIEIVGNPGAVPAGQYRDLVVIDVDPD